MITAKRFYMIRHGETEANAAQIMAGSLDSPLNDTGRAQALEARTVIENLKERPQAIIHSHLSRARETAEIINTHMDLPMTEEPDLAEMHAGEWEGVPYDVCRSLLTGWDDPPGGETFAQFLARVRRGKNRALSAHDGPVLFVCHGGVFRAFAKLYDVDIWGVRNCHLHEFLPEAEREPLPWRVQSYHFDRQLVARASDSYHPEEAAEEIA